MSEIDILREIETLRLDVERLKRVEYAPIACRVYNDANFTHNSNGNYLAVTFNSERWDVSGMHSTSSNTSRITFALGGWYLVGGGIGWDANATGVRELAIRLGGSTYIAANQIDNFTANYQYMTISTLYYFAATNYIELMAYQNSGGNLAIIAAASYTPEFWAMRLP